MTARKLFKHIVSGGQTGVDRAALDFAIAHGIPHSGWCPKGRLATDGTLPPKHMLSETASGGYRQRTKLNVQDSDATLIFNVGDLDGGTLQTARFAETMRKPHRIIQLDRFGVDDVSLQVVLWLSSADFSVTKLNVAGPREEKRAGIYALVVSVLERCLFVPAHEVEGSLKTNGPVQKGRSDQQVVPGSGPEMTQASYSYALHVAMTTGPGTKQV